MRYRKDIGRFLNARGLTGRGAEIGVEAGAFSRQVLDAWQGRRLDLVDPWAPQPPLEYEDACNVPAERQEQNLRATRERLKPHEGRCNILRMTSLEAAAARADAALDFVYIDANHKYGHVRADLAAWWPKVKAGGLVAGSNYFDGIVNESVFGVKSAVGDFAAEHRLQVRLTFDDWPTWFFLKPSPDRQSAPKRIGVLTAYDERQRDLALYSSPNKARYCRRHGYDFIEQTSGFPAGRPAVWGKIRFVQQHLPRYDWIFWTDADSLILNQAVRLEELTDDEFDVVICHEDLGVGVYNINAGQILFRNTPWALRFLDEVWDQTWALDDPHQEQRALIHLLWSQDLSEHVQVVTQNRFNSYPETYARGDFLLHFPDLPPDVRRRLMRQYAQFG